MSKLSKSLDKLRSKPKNFTWNEAVSLMKGYGFTLIKNSGSKRKFYNEASDVIVIIHEPHPRKELKPYQVDGLLEGLENAGCIKNE